MATQKTLPTDADVQAFLEAVTPSRRRSDGLRLAALAREVTDVDPVMWGPSIVGYGSTGTWPTFSFSPRKTALTIYGLTDRPDADHLRARLGDCTISAGCIYVKDLDRVDVEVLRELIATAWARTDSLPS